MRFPHAVVLTMVASACTSGIPPPSEAPATVTPTEQPVRGGVIIEPVAQDIPTLRPLDMREAPVRRAVGLIYDSLAVPDPQTGEARPRLGTWAVSTDGRSYTWHISEHAAWSDGTPVTAADFLTWVTALALYLRAKDLPAFAFHRVEGFSDFFAGKAGDISGIELDPLDQKRMTVRLTGVSCAAVAQLFMNPLLPTHVFGRYLTASAGTDIVSAPEFDAPPVASGPFRFSEWRRGDQLTLIRNETYFRGAPLLDAYVFKVAPTPWGEALQRGSLSYVPVAIPSARALASDGSVRVRSTTRGDYTFIGWNTESRALRDRRVRQALAYGLDGELALREIYEGFGVRMLAHHPPGHWALPNGLDGYRHDPAKARALIEEAGYVVGADGFYVKDGERLAFTIATNADPQRTRLLQFAVDQYMRIGVDVTPVVREFGELVESVTTGEPFDAVILGWSVSADGDPFDFWHSSKIPVPGQNRTGFAFTRFSTSELDRALEQGSNGPDCSVAARQQSYATFNRILNLEQPYYFGFGAVSLRAVTVRLHGSEAATFALSGALDLDDVHRWWLEPEKKD